MTDVLVPLSDVNSDTAVVVSWKVEEGARVDKGAPLVELETSKAVLEVVAPEDGVLLRRAEVGVEVALTEPIAELLPSAEAYEKRKAELAAPAPPQSPADTLRITAKARRKAEALGVDLDRLDASRLITEKMVEAAARAAAAPTSELPSPLVAPAGNERVLVIGGARGATQVIDIFRGGKGQTAVAIVDDNPGKWGEQVYDVPIVGGSDRMAELFEAGAFDAAIVAISTSVAARTRLRERCEGLGIPLTNAIDTTSKIASEVRLGRGNVICAFCQIGTSAVVGDNNFISAYNSFEHHNHIGTDISTGPGCVTSSRVKIGDRCRLGTGIFIEPGVELGDEVRVASGAILVRSVPARHTVKTRVVTTTVVPNG